jgi:hypothetical protein
LPLGFYEGFQNRTHSIARHIVPSSSNCSIDDVLEGGRNSRSSSKLIRQAGQHALLQRVLSTGTNVSQQLKLPAALGLCLSSASDLSLQAQAAIANSTVMRKCSLRLDVTTTTTFEIGAHDKGGYPFQLRTLQMIHTYRYPNAGSVAFYAQLKTFAEDFIIVSPASLGCDSMPYSARRREGHWCSDTKGRTHEVSRREALQKLTESVQPISNQMPAKAGDSTPSFVACSQSSRCPTDTTAT